MGTFSSTTKPTVEPPNPDNIPEEQKKIPHWVLFKHENVQGVWCKQYFTSMKTPARIDELSTLDSFPLVVSTYQRGGFDGIEFVQDKNVLYSPDLHSAPSLELDQLPTNLEAAVKYAAGGWPVFPCLLNKKPVGQLASHGFKSASTDLAQVKKWWEARPDASIGIPTGPRIGAFVLDVDLPEGPASLDKLEATHGALPVTLEQRTGSGGRQLFFRWPEGREVRNSASQLGEGLDVRGDGGYVIVPPSRNLKGVYEWLNESSIAEAPSWLLDLVAPPRESRASRLPILEGTPPPGSDNYGQAALRDELARLAQAAEGQRNHTLNQAAFALGQLVGGGILDRGQVESSLHAHALAIGLGEHEARKTIASGLGKGQLEPRRPQEREARPAEEKGGASTVSVAAMDDDWTPPDRPWPVLSPKALAGIVGDFVKLATRKSEADPAAILATFLTRFGTELCGFAPKSGPYVQVSDGWHRPRLFTAIVGDSSKARKGTSAQPVKRLFTFGDGEHFPATMTPGPLSSGEGLIFAVRDEVKVWQTGKKAGEEAGWVVSDPGVTDKRLFVLDEELAAALHSTNRKGNILSTVLRGLWDSGDAAPITKTSPTKTTGAHVCIVSHVTIAELKAMLDQVQVFNGFANRFLWVCARRQRLVPFPEPMPEVELNRIRRELVRLIQLAQGRGRIVLNDDARVMWEAAYPELAKAHPGISGCIINRGEAQAYRLAMIYALLDGQDRVNASHLEAALTFWSYCQASALFIFGEHEVDPVAEKIIAALKEGPKSTTELYQALGNNLTSDRMKTALEELTRDGRVRLDKVPTATKPKNLFRLNDEYELFEVSPSPEGDNPYSSYNSYQDEKKMVPSRGLQDPAQAAEVEWVV